MKKISSLLIICLLVGLNNTSIAQTTFFEFNSESEYYVNRFILKSGTLRNNIYTDIRPMDRRMAGKYISSYDTFNLNHSKVDQYQLDYLKADNHPWSNAEMSDNDNPLFRHFYRSKANFYHVDEENFNFFLNPGLNLVYIHDESLDEPGFINTRSAEIRGTIDNRLAFYSFVSENQARLPLHVREFHDSVLTLPGAHFNKRYKETGYDYFLARGYINFNAGNHINFTFGQDRNFIGNGYRSLLLSDFATDYTFLRVNTNIWRFNYQNIFARFIDNHGVMLGRRGPRPLPVKYGAFHYLSLDILHNLNFGLFEGVIFHDNLGTGRGFDIAYLNPIIFYRSVEHMLGDPDKMIVGANINYLPIPGIALYGQFMLNEFVKNKLFGNEGYIHNKFGYQAGVKYMDVGGISNLDLQLEYNAVRPYSYTHYSLNNDYPVNTYSNYNQPLAHPLGANFRELVIMTRYQPVKKLTSTFKAVIAHYGADSAGSNWGKNIFVDYNEYERETGNYITQGVFTELIYLELLLSYEIWHNIRLDLSVANREINSALNDRNQNAFYINAAFRMNLPYRSFDF